MPDIVLTEGELEVLSRCSGVAVKAYLRIRARMDFESGIAGHRAGLSYQALREWTEEAVEKGAGEVILQPSLRNVRTAVEQLVRRGLLRRARTERLVFRCLLARTGEVRPKRTRHEPGRANGAEPGTEPDTNPAGVCPEDAQVPVFFDTEPDMEPDTNPAGQNGPNPAHIRYPCTPSTPHAASTDLNGVDPGEGRSAARGLAEKMTGPVEQPGPMRDLIGLVALLHKRGAKVNAMDPRVIAWVRDGIDEGLILRALDIAKDRRGPCAQPVNAGYLDAIVRDLVERESRPPREPAWWKSDAGTLAKGREMGLEAHVGEDMPAYRARLFAAERRPQG